MHMPPASRPTTRWSGASAAPVVGRGAASIVEARANALRAGPLHPGEGPGFTGTRSFDEISLEASGPDRLVAILRRLGVEGSLFRLLDDAVVGAQARTLHADAVALLPGSSPSGCSWHGPSSASGRRMPSTTTSSCTRTTSARRCWHGCAPSPAAAQARGEAQPGSRGLRRRRRSPASRLHRRVRGDGGERSRSWRRPSRRPDDYHAIMTKALADRLAEATRS